MDGGRERGGGDGWRTELERWMEDGRIEAGWQTEACSDGQTDGRRNGGVDRQEAPSVCTGVVVFNGPMFD